MEYDQMTEIGGKSVEIKEKKKKNQNAGPVVIYTTKYYTFYL